MASNTNCTRSGTRGSSSMSGSANATNGSGR
jgi:hypothetical protein